MNSREGKLLNDQINQQTNFLYKPRTQAARKVINILEADEFIKIRGTIIIPTCKITLKIFRQQLPIKVTEIDRKVREYLRAPLTGQLLLTTNKGVMGHREALVKRTGGYMIGYYY